VTISPRLSTGQQTRSGERRRAPARPVSSAWQWARDHGVAFDSRDTAKGSTWRGRVEHYLTNPAKEPDPAKWEVDVAYLVSKA